MGGTRGSIARKDWREEKEWEVNIKKNKSVLSLYSNF